MAATPLETPESSARPRISVVVPVFDEEPALLELTRRLRSALGADTELIFVDDGSRDGSRERLIEIVRATPGAIVIGFRKNYGKSHALAAGFRRARGDSIVTIDADLQDLPESIPRLLDVLAQGSDVVGGWRRVRSDAQGKVVGSTLFNRIVSLVAGTRFHDINCGLKVFRRAVIDEIRLASGYHRFLPLLAHWRGFRVVEVEVDHAPRLHGRTKYGRLRFVGALMDLATLVFLERFDGRPGRYLALLGVGSGAIGFAILAYLAALRFLQGTIQFRYPLLVLGALLVVVGLQFASVGFLSELIAYHFRSRTPRDPWASEASPEPAREEPTRR
jgi:glycosyltransferase involved in cell wall biosynthesis